MSNDQTEKPDGTSSEQDSALLNIVDDHVEEVISPTGKKVRRKGVYLLPNLFTTAALFAGFFAIISGMKGNFESAGLAIIVAQLLDGFDGRVARMTNTTSAFGVEYDSLSDMVSFGLAPALVIFSWGLEPLGKFGWAAAFIFTACAALRLARFNTQAASADNRYFVGLASPPAAAVLATLVWSWPNAQPSIELAFGVALLTIVLGLLMVSNIRYFSFKGFNVRGRVPFVFMLAALLIFVVIVVDPPRILLLIALTYCLSGPVVALYLYRQRSARASSSENPAASNPPASSADAEAVRNDNGPEGVTTEGASKENKAPGKEE